MILHVITGLGAGGAESLLDTMVRTDTTNEHAIISLHTDGHYGAALREHGIAVHTLGMPRGRLTLSGIRELFRLIRHYDPRVIQSWMYHANLLSGLLGRLAGKNCIVWGLHNDRMVNASRSMIISNRVCAQLSGFIPRRVIHCSETGARYHLELGYSKKTMCVVPNGYDVSRYHPSADARRVAREALGIADECLLLGMIARWHPQKDHANLISAVASLPPAQRERLHLLFVGSDMSADNQALQSLIEGAGLTDRITCLGERRDVPELMNALDLHVLSSAFGESFPNVVNEAMASGIPCIVTDVGDSARIVGDTGWVVAPSDSSALAAAITLAMQAHAGDDWAARQRACRQHVVDNYTIEAMLQRYQEIWDAAS